MEIWLGGWHKRLQSSRLSMQSVAPSVPLPLVRWSCSSVAEHWQLKPGNWEWFLVAAGFSFSSFHLIQHQHLINQEEIYQARGKCTLCLPTSCTQLHVQILQVSCTHQSLEPQQLVLMNPIIAVLCWQFRMLFCSSVGFIHASSLSPQTSSGMYIAENTWYWKQSALGLVFGLFYGCTNMWCSCEMFMKPANCITVFII